MLVADTPLIDIDVLPVVPDVVPDVMPDVVPDVVPGVVPGVGNVPPIIELIVFNLFY